ncbi:hypothetical protein BXZ70DRAFT_1067261 [Cristinia sonorae]|uniref:F-box domain-containing protein n=1 Tax=Cristinia sonorae TaxID=1940300 RepID=A0A8K0XM91_9AGAR|nr:hypothetical protein BXZ70DRAFT_1067261 [Cristinia sonorae]
MSVPPSSHSSRLSREQFRKQLQDEVALHRRAIVDLHVQMNTTIPIAVLPPEMLACIFSWYIIAVAHANTAISRGWYLPSNSASHYRWIKITHVCHHWREVALSSPELWTDILVEGAHECIEAFLSRSKQALLDIFIPTSHNQTMDVIQRVFGAISRARTFSLCSMSTDSASEVLLNSLPSSAPHLRVLEMSLGGTLPVSASFPPFLTQCAAPSLTELTITRYQVDWKTGVFPKSLTHLHIVHPTEKSTKIGTSSASVVAVLAELGSLKHIELAQVLPDLSLPDDVISLPSLPSTASLPNLEYLSLRGSSLPCVVILKHCIFPETARVMLHLNSVLSPTTLRLIAPPIHAKVVNAISVGGKPKLSNILVQAFGGIRLFSLGQTISRAEIYVPSLLTLIELLLVEGPVPRIPLRQVRALSISAFSEEVSSTELDPLARLIHRLPRLQYLLCEGVARSNIIAWLRLRQKVSAATVASQNSETPGPDRRPYAMPQLSHLVLRNVRFRRVNPYCDDDPGSGLTHDLCETMELRKGTCAQLKKITILKCLNMDEDDVAILSALTKIIWDKVVDYDETDDDDEDDSEFDDYDDYDDELW